MEDISLISEIESSKLQLSHQKFPIQDLVKDVFDELSMKAKSKGIGFRIMKGCEDPIKVLADRGKGYQVLANLFDNAIKYGKENGTVTVSFYNIDDQKALIEVSDDGLGIDKEHLSRVFECFLQNRQDPKPQRRQNRSGSGHSETHNRSSQANLM